MKNFWKRNKAKIRCIYFALVRFEKFEAKRSEKTNLSRERVKRMRNGSLFASFRFEAKNFFGGRNNDNDKILFKIFVIKIFNVAAIPLVISLVPAWASWI
jgi:hypothetical protein